MISVSEIKKNYTINAGMYLFKWVRLQWKWRLSLTFDVRFQHSEDGRHNNTVISW